MLQWESGLEFRRSSGSAHDVAVDYPPGLTLEFAEPARRHLAIIDQSRLRRDCLKLALGQQPRRWRVTDVAVSADLVRLVREGESFAMILLGASTCGHVDLVDIVILAAAVPHMPILVIADCDDQERARAILRSGARGFLPTNLSLKVLVAALERIRAGGTYVPLELSAPAPADAPGKSARSPWQELTRRQRDVLALISEGKPNKLIADALTMSESTVKAHVKQIIKRLHVANRTQAALLATRPSHRGPGAIGQAAERVL
jgi:two-component system, NarL family, nitrate/nitrite response regulator NarL